MEAATAPTSRRLLGVGEVLLLYLWYLRTTARVLVLSLIADWWVHKQTHAIDSKLPRIMT